MLDVIILKGVLALFLTLHAPFLYTFYNRLASFGTPVPQRLFNKYINNNQYI